MLIVLIKDLFLSPKDTQIVLIFRDLFFWSEIELYKKTNVRYVKNLIQLEWKDEPRNDKE